MTAPNVQAKSTVVRKENRLVLKMKKAATGLEWSDLTDTVDKKKQEREHRIAAGDLKGSCFSLSLRQSAAFFGVSLGFWRELVLSARCFFLSDRDRACAICVADVLVLAALLLSLPRALVRPATAAAPCCR